MIVIANECFYFIGLQYKIRIRNIIYILNIVISKENARL